MGHFGFVCQVTKQLVDKLVQEHDEEVVRKNHHFQGPKLLEALSVLCECNGVPIIRNQGYACHIKLTIIIKQTLNNSLDQIYASLREVFQDGKVVSFLRILVLGFVRLRVLDAAALIITQFL